MWAAAILLTALSLHSMISVLASIGKVEVEVTSSGARYQLRADNRGLIPTDVRFELDLLDSEGAVLGGGAKELHLPPMGSGRISLGANCQRAPSTVRLRIFVSAAGLASLSVKVEEVVGG